MKKCFFNTLTLLLLAGLVLFSACSDNTDPTVKYSLTVNQPASGGSFTVRVNGNTAVSGNTEAAAGDTITLNAAPAPEFSFSGFTLTPAQTLSGNGNTRTFTMPSRTVSIRAVFIESGSENDINLSAYTIVYPQDAPGLEKHSADFLSDYIFEISGLRLPFSADTETQETGKEILIGATNRTASSTAQAFYEYGDNNIIIWQDNEKIILYGEQLMLAGAVGQFASTYIKANQSAREISKTLSISTYLTALSKSVLVLFGDGMGMNHIEYFRSLSETDFFADYLPYKGILMTTDLNGAATDSAAGGTAMFSGIRTINGTLGLDPDGVPIKSIRQEAYERGYKTGIATTDVAHGNTAGALTAHVQARYDDIISVKAQQELLLAEGKLDYLIGTGTGYNWDHIYPNNQWIQFSSGLIHPGSRGTDIYEYVKECLWTIRSDKFFALIEEDDIDNYSHEPNSPMQGKLDNLFMAMGRFNNYMGYSMAFAMAHPGTAIIVAADHETGNLTNTGGTFRYNSLIHSNADVDIFVYGDGGEIFHNQTVWNNEVGKYLGRLIGASENFSVPVTVDLAAAFVATVNALEDNPSAMRLNGLVNNFYNTRLSAEEKQLPEVLAAYYYVENLRNN